MNKQVIIGLLTLSMVARLVATPESDYKDFVKTFCQVAAGLNKTQKLITDDPQFNNSPLAELLVTTGANGGKRLCNVFTQVDTLVGSFNPQDQHSYWQQLKSLKRHQYVCKRLQQRMSVHNVWLRQLPIPMT